MIHPSIHPSIDSCMMDTRPLTHTNEPTPALPGPMPPTAGLCKYDPSTAQVPKTERVCVTRGYQVHCAYLSAQEKKTGTNHDKNSSHHLRFNTNTREPQLYVPREKKVVEQLGKHTEKRKLNAMQKNDTNAIRPPDRPKPNMKRSAA